LILDPRNAGIVTAWLICRTGLLNRDGNGRGRERTDPDDNLRARRPDDLLKTGGLLTPTTGTLASEVGL
jgi:hypothetical protein